MCTQKRFYKRKRRQAPYMKVAAFWKVRVICHLGKSSFSVWMFTTLPRERPLIKSDMESI